PSFPERRKTTSRARFPMPTSSSTTASDIRRAGRNRCASAATSRPLPARRRIPSATETLDGALEHVSTGALGRRAADEHHELLIGLVYDLQHRPGIDVHEPADRNLMPFGRIAEVHRQRSAQRDEGLILRALCMARADRARLVPDQVRAGVPQPDELGERGARAPRETLVLLPLELLGADDPEPHTQPKRTGGRRDSGQGRSVSYSSLSSSRPGQGSPLAPLAWAFVEVSCSSSPCGVATGASPSASAFAPANSRLIPSSRPMTRV